MKKSFLENYHENWVNFEILMSAKKMPENRADGTENEEERKALCYSISEVESEQKHLMQLLTQIRKDGWDSKVKTFIIGVCEDRPGEFFLMDGQHGRAIAKILIEDGTISPDTLFKYTINFYKTYAEMVSALMYINNGKPMKNEQMSRAKTFTPDGNCGESYKAFMELEAKYHGQVRDSLVRTCMFGQNNGSTVYSKHINEFAEQLIQSYINLADNARKMGADSDVMGVVTGVQHGMVALRDLYNIIFTTVFSNNKTDAKEKLISYGMELCDIFNKALLGQFTPPSKGYTLTTVQAMLGYNGSNLKREIVRYINNDVIRFYKRKSDYNEMNSEFIIDCIYEWLNLAKKSKKK